MRTAFRAATVFTLGLGFVAASTVVGDQRERVRTIKGGGITLHEASMQPADGLQRMSLPNGTALYVSPRPSWNAMDVLAADAQPAADGTTMDLRLSGDAAKRVAALGADARIAVFDGSTLISAGTITPEGRVRVTGLSPENAERVSRVVRGETTPVAGPLFTVVPAGEKNGRYLVDVFVQGATDLRSYQVMLVTGGGEAGRLELDAVNTDKTRPDYVFTGLEVIDASSPVTGRLVATLYDGAVNAATPMYLGTYAFRPTADARGMFRVNVELSSETILADRSNNEMGYSAGADARVMVGPRSPKDNK